MRTIQILGWNQVAKRGQAGLPHLGELTGQGNENYERQDFLNPGRQWETGRQVSVLH